MTDRKGDWMGTITGKRFWPIDPRPGDFNIYDIGHALSQTNRYGGHARWPYSVAQHSVLGARQALIYCPSEALTLLLHDASEAYITDVVRPAKVSMPEYAAIEDRIMTALALQFGITWPMTLVAKEIDERMLVTEAPQIMNPPDGIKWWLDAKWPKPYADLRIEPWVPDYARVAFMDLFCDLTASTL